MMRYVKYCDRRNLYNKGGKCQSLCVRVCVCPNASRYLQMNPIHVFDHQEDSTPPLTIPSWFVYARQAGMHYQ